MAYLAAPGVQRLQGILQHYCLAIVKVPRTKNLEGYSPYQILFEQLTTEESKGVINMWVLAYHEWAMAGHRVARYNPTTGRHDDDPDEPMLQLKDEKAPLAFEENLGQSRILETAIILFSYVFFLPQNAAHKCAD